MTKLNDIKFLSGLNVQYHQRNTDGSKIPARYPQMGALVLAFILSFVGSFKSLAHFDSQSRVAVTQEPTALVYDTNQPEVLAAEATESETHIDSVEVKTEFEIPTPTDIVIETPTPTPTLTPTPSPSPSPTPSPVPQPTYSDAEEMRFIDRFAGQYGLDPNVLRHIATCESGFNQHAKNGPYVGLFQFGTSAWVTGRAKMGEDANLNLRLNAEESIQTAAYLLAEGRTDLWPNCIP